MPDAIAQGLRVHLRSGSYVRVRKVFAAANHALCEYTTPTGLEPHGGQDAHIDLPLYVLRAGAAVLSGAGG